MRAVPTVAWVPLSYDPNGFVDGFSGFVEGLEAGRIWRDRGRWHGRLAGVLLGFKAGGSESEAMATFIGRWRRRG